MSEIYPAQKRIIICSNILWTITIYRKYLVSQLKKDGFEVIVVGSLEDFSGKTLNDIRNLNIEYHIIDLDRSSKNPFKDVVYFLKLFGIYKKIMPDIALHFTIKPNIYGSLVCRFLGIPNINTINGLGSGIIKKDNLSRFIKILYKISLRKSATVFFQNIEDLYFFVDNKLVEIERTGFVPGSGINPDEYFLPIKKPDKRKTFLFVGRLLKDKGLYEYINAIKALKEEGSFNAEFLLAGIIDTNNPSSVSADEISQWEQNNLVKYLGKTNDIIELFKNVDFVVLPSYREGLSRMLIEAASCQKVLIASNVPGCKEIVKDEYNGFLCEPKDFISLKTAIEKAILMDGEKYITFAQRSRKLVITDFTSEIVNEIYIKEINRAILSE